MFYRNSNYKVNVNCYVNVNMLILTLLLCSGHLFVLERILFSPKMLGHFIALD